MQVVAVVRRVSAVTVLAGLLLIACDDTSPVRPTPPQSPGPPVPTLVRLEIVGPRSVAPNETAQFGVTGHFSDGSTKDLTTQASWQSQNSSVLSIDAAGRATGVQLGQSNLTARAASMTSTTEIVVVPTGTFRLSVIAREAGSIFLDVRVDVLEGRGTGLSSTRLVNGRYDLYGVAGDALIRVSGRGYKDNLQRIVVTEHMVIEVEMVPSVARVNLSGPYTLTITADPVCGNSLPPEYRSRRYDALVRQLGPEIEVTLAGGDFLVGNAARNRFGGRLDADNSKAVFGLVLSYDYYYYYSNVLFPPPDVIERLGGSTYLTFGGGATTSVSERALSGTLKGPIQLIEMTSPWNVTRKIAECNREHHQFLLSR